MEINATILREPASLLPLAVATCLAVIAVVPPARATTTYEFKSLGALTSGSDGTMDHTSRGFGLNANGDVVGESFSGAFVYSNGTMRRIGRRFEYWDNAISINDSGQFCGTVMGGRAGLYSNGQVIILPGAHAYDINNLGQVVGDRYAADAGPDGHAFLYSNGTVKDLGTLGGASSSAAGINDAGQIVGRSETAANAAYHAFLYSNGVMTDLDPMGLDSYALDINESGQVVGYAHNTSNHLRAVLWHSGVMTDLGTLGGPHALARDINDKGQIVGLSDGRGFLYENGHMTDLNSLLPPGTPWRITSACAINNAGQITGSAASTTGPPREHAFLLTPVPDPTSLLPACTLALLPLTPRRRRRG